MKTTTTKYGLDDYKKMMRSRKGHKQLIALLSKNIENPNIDGNLIRDIMNAADQVSKEVFLRYTRKEADSLREYVELFSKLQNTPITVEKIKNKRKKEIVDRLHDLDFDFSNTEALLDSMEDIDSEDVKDLESGVIAYLTNKKNGGNINANSEREAFALANYYLLKYGSTENSKIRRMRESGFKFGEDRVTDNPFKKCKDNMANAVSKTNPFVDSSNPERYEIQREKYLPATRRLCIFAIASMRGEITNENLRWAEKIFVDYQQKYDQLNNDKTLARAYHAFTHAVLQIMPPEIVSIILRIQKAEDIGTKEELGSANAMIQDLIKNDPQIARKVYHGMIHDVIQPFGPDWQKDAMAALKEGKLTLADLVLAKPDVMKKYRLDECGFSNPAMKDFILLAAKIFFPGQDRGYDKAKSFEGFKKGAAEFLSVVYAYYTEAVKGKEDKDKKPISLAKQIRMCVSLAATIPFDQNEVFFKNSYEKVKILLRSFSANQKKELLAEFEKENLFPFHIKGLKSDEKLDYAVATMFAEACAMANMDVENFATKDDILQIYWGNYGVFAEIFKLPKYVFENTPEQRIPVIIFAIKDKSAGSNESEAGFSYANADKGIIYHYFECEFKEIGSSSKREVDFLHARAKNNFAKVVEMHDFDLIDAAVEYCNPSLCLDGKKLAEMTKEDRDAFRKSVTKDVMKFFEKKQHTQSEKDELIAKCRGLISRIDKNNRHPAGLIFHMESNRIAELAKKNKRPVTIVQPNRGDTTSQKLKTSSEPVRVQA